ncbi:hypothetical protein ACLOJK_008374 [Asimina triloba]
MYSSSGHAAAAAAAVVSLSLPNPKQILTASTSTSTSTSSSRYRGRRSPLLLTTFLPPTFPPSKPPTLTKTNTRRRRRRPISSKYTSSSPKIIRNPSLDRHVAKHNKLRFVHKLKTLLLSKPRHYLTLPILSKCRSYLSLPPRRSILSMIKRYPAIFELFSPPHSPTYPHDPPLSVRLTPAASSLALQESLLKSHISSALASKLQKLLMLSSHRRLLLSKLAHLAPDLGLPANFRPHLCHHFPQRFRTVDTSYGLALELVSWDPQLAVPFPAAPAAPPDRIIDRPAKFKQLRLQKGVNLKRRHRDYLIKFGELPEVNPYVVDEMGPPPPYTMDAERRACAVVREVLSMTVEKKTLVDHLTHFRKEFGLPNRLWGMLVRHPDMFYVSVKGQRDSVFLMEAYDQGGKLLLGEDDLLVAKKRLMELVSEGKRMRRWRRNNVKGVDDVEEDEEEEEEDDDCDDDDDDDSLEELFDAGIEDGWEDFGIDEEEHVADEVDLDGSREFWSLNGFRKDDGGCNSGGLESW